MKVSDGWKKVNLGGKTKLKKTFSFSDFTEVTDFVQQIVPIANKQRHHPDLHIYDYKMLDVILFTHDADCITQKDTDLSALIDALI